MSTIRLGDGMLIIYRVRAQSVINVVWYYST